KTSKNRPAEFCRSAGRFYLSLAIILSDTVQTNLVSNQYQQAKRQAKKPVFMRVSEVSEIIPTQS
ncbi:hypothetical protein, partial [Agathobaculum butyriciproducens]|uniref:hypothetical protein n=1 Tax=Agathobaculum butyriciproducens TaxID=1628085 RepID=UPI003AF0DC61